MVAINLINKRALELERIRIAKEKRAMIKTAAVKINSYTKIFPKEDPSKPLTEEEKAKAAEKFQEGWSKSQEFHSKHAEPYLNK